MRHHGLPFKLSLLLIAVAMLLSGFACSPNKTTDSGNQANANTNTNTNTSNTGQITVTDTTGQVVTLDGPATRIVVLTPSDCEILYALSAGNSVVGRGTYCDYPESVLSIPDVQSGSDMNVEQILSLQPQVVLTAEMTQNVQPQIDALRKAGVAVIVDDAKTIDETYRSIQTIGKITGREDKALALVGSMQEAFAKIQAAVPAGDKKSVYFEVSPLQYGLWAGGKGTFMDELANMLGLTNVFADVEGWAEISEEQVINRNPDLIITVTMYYGDGPTPQEEIIGRPGWDKITAVRDGKVFYIDNNEIARPGPRLVDAAQNLFHQIYPDASL